MAIEITEPDGTKRIIPRAIGAHGNHRDGTWDFKDAAGEVVEKVPMHPMPNWRPAKEPQKDER